MVFFRSSHQNLVCTSPVPHTCYTPRPSHTRGVYSTSLFPHSSPPSAFSTGTVDLVGLRGTRGHILTDVFSIRLVESPFSRFQVNAGGQLNSKLTDLAKGTGSCLQLFLGNAPKISILYSRVNKLFPNRQANYRIIGK